MIIYKIANNINGKIYVGQTIKSLDHRICCHLRLNKTPVQKALNKYGIQSFIISIIDTAESKEVLDEKERYWIKFLNSKFPNGYNLTDGGEGIKNPSAEIRIKMGGNREARKWSNERKERTSKRMMGHPVSDKVKEVTGNINKGKHLSEITKRRMRETIAKNKNLVKKCKKCGRIREPELRQCPICKKNSKRLWARNNPDKIKEQRKRFQKNKKLRGAK
jgi:group I intron endonuclease